MSEPEFKELRNGQNLELHTGEKNIFAHILLDFQIFRFWELRIWGGECAICLNHDYLD